MTTRYIRSPYPSHFSEKKITIPALIKKNTMSKKLKITYSDSDDDFEYLYITRAPEWSTRSQSSSNIEKLKISS